MITPFRRLLFALTGGIVALAPVTSVAFAQDAPAATCAIASGPLTKQQNSIVNDYEILVARANSKHTPVPPIPSDVALLIGCDSGPATAAPPQSPSSSVAGSTTTGVSCAGGFTPLTKQQNSMVNDYEILVARANSKHTPVPPIPPDVAALIACQ